MFDLPHYLYSGVSKSDLFNEIRYRGLQLYTPFRNIENYDFRTMKSPSSKPLGSGNGMNPTTSSHIKDCLFIIFQIKLLERQRFRLYTGVQVVS